jgi:hemerythrin
MEKLEWTNDFSVNVKELDDQHQKMFAIINDLQEQIDLGKGNQILSRVFKQMHEYAIFHFTSEEKLLMGAGCPLLDQQKVEHAYFIQKLSVFNNDFRNFRIGLAKEVMSFLRNWWKLHILNHDKQFSAFLNEKGIF